MWLGEKEGTPQPMSSTSCTHCRTLYQAQPLFRVRSCLGYPRGPVMQKALLARTSLMGCPAADISSQSRIQMYLRQALRRASSTGYPLRHVLGAGYLQWMTRPLRVCLSTMPLPTRARVPTIRMRCVLRVYSLALHVV